MYIVLPVFALFMGLHVWAVRAYLNFMATHPDIEKRLVERAMRQSY